MSSFMDQSSCSFLFKRWSDDYENSQRLQQELTALKEQYDCLLGQCRVLQHNLKQGTHTQSNGDSAELSENVNELIQCLKNENNDLHLALQHHGEQAASNSQSISKLNEELQRLTLENTTLTEQRNQITIRYEEMADKFKDLQVNVKTAHDANTRLEEQTAEATRQLKTLNAEIARVATITDKFKEDEVHHNELVASYEKQIHDMKQTLDLKDNENKGLRAELSNSRDTLQKLRESNRYLTTSVANLQGTILHKLNGSHPPPGDANQAQQHSTHQQRPLAGSSTIKAPNNDTGTTNGGAKPSTHDPKADGDKTTMQTTLQLTTASTTPMPRERHQAFAGVSQVALNITDAGEKALFERNFLKSTIGGAIQSLIVRVTDSQTPLAKARRISAYLCPSLDHNPWCPAVPGEHGYMFVGLGREKETFLEPQDFNVFVGLCKDKSFERRNYRYVGVYRAVRVSPLNVDEWNTLSESVKETYVSRTKTKTNDRRTFAQIRAAYDEGTLLVPCVKLQCVDYDDVLFASLVETNSKPLPAPVNKGSSSTKRRRVSNEDSIQIHKNLKKVTLIV